jgi:glycosyltransferase involved in cell wall biosynthesis
LTTQLKFKTVLIDATSLNRRMKGVGRYAYNLCCQLDARLPKKWRLLLVVVSKELPDFPEGFRGEFVTVPNASELSFGLRVFPRLIREYQADVFIRPADKIGRGYGLPTLTVCHDLNPLIWAVQPPRPFKRQVIDAAWEYLRGFAMRKSDLVICNSEFVRDAACKHFGLDRKRTVVGPCGVDPRITELASLADLEVLRSEFGGKGFILTFATGDEREGFRSLPRLWAATREAGYPGRLVVVGVEMNALYTKKLREDFSSLGISESVVLQPFLGESELPRLSGLYAAADFYLETSRHEGFGMQLIEAMACGTTCFSTGKGALMEIGGGFPLKLADDPITAGYAIATQWHCSAHLRNNDRQVAYAKTFNWNIVGRIAGEFIMHIEKD